MSEKQGNAGSVQLPELRQVSHPAPTADQPLQLNCILRTQQGNKEKESTQHCYQIKTTLKIKQKIVFFTVHMGTGSKNIKVIKLTQP